MTVITMGAQTIIDPENSSGDGAMRLLRRVNTPIPGCKHFSSEWVGVAAAKIRERAFPASSRGDP